MSAPSETSPQRLPPLSREGIVSAASDLISQNGHEQLSLRKLAHQLGVTAPALYAHVTDKQDLLSSVAELQFAALMTRFEAVGVLVEDSNPLERLRALGNAYVAHATANPNLFRVMFLFPPVLGANSEPGITTSSSSSEVFGVAAASVEAAIEAGLLREIDPLVAALALWSAAHGIASVLQMGFGFDEDFQQALADSAIAISISGLQRR